MARESTPVLAGFLIYGKKNCVHNHNIQYSFVFSILLWNPELVVMALDLCHEISCVPQGSVISDFDLKRKAVY